MKKISSNLPRKILKILYGFQTFPTYFNIKKICYRPPFKERIIRTKLVSNIPTKFDFPYFLYGFFFKLLVTNNYVF